MGALNPTLQLQDAVFQQNQALIAKLNGQFTHVYRVGPTTNVSVLAGPPIFDIFPAMVTRTTSRKFIENAMFELVMFQAITDTTVLQYGDLLVDNATGERYVYGQRRPLTAAIFVRTETLATIGQPFNPGSARPRTPRPPGGTFVPNYAQARPDTTQPITLTNGAFALGSVGDVPAQIPVGIQLKPNIGAPLDPDITNSIQRATYVLYIPPLPGSVVVRENMVVSVIGTDVQYVVLSCITSMEGFVGTVCVVQKVGV